ncbi:hypothetical protein ACTQ49_04900 [Luteococcus sp. Sow4_B9]|uniref:hypothetical protein n=1 Tax=Luteococcus sp. Sow4_B9 TaxID=3438792 RepID=UPI003F98C1AE
MQFTTPPGGVLLEDETVVKGAVDVILDEARNVLIRPAGGEEERKIVADGPVEPGMTIDVVVARLAFHPGNDDSGRPMPTSLAVRPSENDGYLDDEPERIGDELW